MAATHSLDEVLDLLLSEERESVDSAFPIHGSPSGSPLPLFQSLVTPAFGVGYVAAARQAIVELTGS